MRSLLLYATLLAAIGGRTKSAPPPTSTHKAGESATATGTTNQPPSPAPSDQTSVTVAGLEAMKGQKIDVVVQRFGLPDEIWPAEQTQIGWSDPNRLPVAVFLYNAVRRRVYVLADAAVLAVDPFKLDAPAVSGDSSAAQRATATRNEDHDQRAADRNDDMRNLIGQLKGLPVEGASLGGPYVGVSHNDVTRRLVAKGAAAIPALTSELSTTRDVPQAIFIVFCLSDLHAAGAEAAVRQVERDIASHARFNVSRDMTLDMQIKFFLRDVGEWKQSPGAPAAVPNAAGAESRSDAAPPVAATVEGLEALRGQKIDVMFNRFGAPSEVVPRAYIQTLFPADAPQPVIVFRYNPVKRCVFVTRDGTIMSVSPSLTDEMSESTSQPASAP